MKTSNIGAPLMFSKREQTKTPQSQSSHTGTTKESILSKLYKDLTSALLISTPVGPMKTQNVPDVKKPDQLFALRGTVSQPKQQPPSNIMAGTPSPKPLSGAPKPPGGNLSPSPGALGGSASGPGALGGSASGPGPQRPGVPGAVGPGPQRPTVAGPPPAPIVCNGTNCKATTSAVSPLQGTISMTIPMDASNKPDLAHITNVSFIPFTAAGTIGTSVAPLKKPEVKVTVKPDGTKVKVITYPNGRQVTVTKNPNGQITRTVSGPKAPPPFAVSPPRFYSGPPKTTVYSDGRKVTISKGRAITVYPDGRTVIVTRGFGGRINRKVVSPPPPPLAVSSTGKPLPPKTVLPPLPGGIYGNKAVSEAVIAPGQQLVSINGRFKAVMQTDGNFVIYKDRTAIWALQSVNVPWYGPGRRAVMQNDGNFVIYDKRGKPVWATGTNNPNRPTRIVMHNRGNLCIYDNIGNRKWCSNTRQPSVNCEGKWSECSKTCGGGQQMYSVTRKADFGGNPCPNKDGDMRPCNTDKCPKPVDCKGEWSECSKKCGGGNQYYKVLQPSQFDGKKCEAFNGKKRSCNTQSCGTPCEGSWNTKCSKPCGGGILTYTVTKPATGLGAPCSNKTGDTKPCNTDKCADSLKVPGYRYLEVNELPSTFTLISGENKGLYVFNYDPFMVEHGSINPGVDKILALQPYKSSDVYNKTKSGMWYTLSTPGSKGNPKRFLRHSNYVLYTQDYSPNNYDFAWALYLKNGTNNKVILYNPFPGDDKGYWVSEFYNNGKFPKIGTQDPSNAHVFTISPSI